MSRPKISKGILRIQTVLLRRTLRIKARSMQTKEMNLSAGFPRKRNSGSLAIFIQKMGPRGTWVSTW
jgi:hypothetical protein